MKPPILLKTIRGLLILLCLYSSPAVLQAQLIDSVFVNAQSNPNEIYVKILGLDGSKHNYRIDSSFQNNTMQVNFIFKDCASPAVVFDIDTTVVLKNFDPSHGYNVRVVTYLDTNTVDFNCYVRQSYEYFDSVYFPASTIFLGSDDQRPIPSSFTLLPNPASSNFSINVEEPLGSRIEEIMVYSINGELLRTCQYTQERIFDIQDLKPGLYFVKLETATGKSSHISKLLISR
ncbi:MAG: hypothetical protein CMH28_02480 [Micavibrio sp.]|nr:hypothetical protein [Micavibrio sp.]|tara:strand:+ start:1074 stop:1769 length:696 start_codon:yes stop_codon:yes gene_type:complete